MDKQYFIKTETGSHYRWYVNADGTQFIAGENITSDISKPLGDKAYPIEPAETPKVGQEWLFFALKSLAKNDPHRMPGGGKLTSRVTEFGECEPWPV